MKKLTIKQDHFKWVVDVDFGEQGHTEHCNSLAEALGYASELDPSIVSVEVKRLQAQPKEVELNPGMVLESPGGRRRILCNDSGDAIMSHRLISLDFDLRPTQDLDEGWGTLERIRELLARGWKLLPGRVEYVEPGEKPAQAEDTRLNAAVKWIELAKPLLSDYASELSDELTQPASLDLWAEIQALLHDDSPMLLGEPTSSEYNPLPAIEPGMGLSVDTPGGYQFVIVADASQKDRFLCWGGGITRNVPWYAVRVVFDRAGQVVWQRRSS